jgi:squalene-hopene/tetraprenyl-beta-curcumene cyclase
MTIVLGAIGCAVSLAGAGDMETRARARAAIDRAIAYLQTQQNAETGGWRESTDGPSYPAITGLVVTGMMLDPRIDERDPTVAAGVRNILSYAKPEGGIHDGALPTYNTAICLSALAKVRLPEATSAVSAGQGYLRTLQYHGSNTGGDEAPTFTEPVTEDHPYYGGVGYGRHGRPDLSNLGFFLQALHDTGVSTEDPAVKRAMVFLERVQMLDETNDMAYADGSNQGGFIYATVPNLESVDGRAGQSMSGTVEETNEEGGRLTRLRAYGSMTYVGFKSLVYADLSSGDPRVDAAWRWINEHYTMDENPGMGDQGRYYYYCSMARALDAFGAEEVAGRDWRADLVTTLTALQEPDGSFRMLNDRWMEADPVLVTAYALIALQHAAGNTN